MVRLVDNIESPSAGYRQVGLSLDNPEVVKKDDLQLDRVRRPVGGASRQWHDSQSTVWPVLYMHILGRS